MAWGCATSSSVASRLRLPQREIRKTALGAEEAVSWSYHAHPFEALAHVRACGGVAMAVEEGAGSQPLAGFVPPTDCPLVLVFGNEPDGVSPEVLSVVDGALWIPMRGIKRSLNVAVAGRHRPAPLSSRVRGFSCCGLLLP